MTEEDRATITSIAGKVVAGIGTSPVLLALVVLNLFSVGGILWSVREERKLERETTAADQQIIAGMAKLIAECQPHSN